MHVYAQEVAEGLLKTSVKMALNPDRGEPSLLEMAKTFERHGEIESMKALYAHIERFQTALRLEEDWHV